MFCLYGLCNPFILFKSIINMYVDFQGQRFPSRLCKLISCVFNFCKHPVLAMTATATRQDREEIKRLLGFKQCVDVGGNPD